MFNSIVAGIVLYNPENENYIDSIRVLIDIGIKVVIFDNSSEIEVRNVNLQKINSQFLNSASYLSDHRGNIGLAKAFNKLVKSTISDINLEGIFLFDQDSEVKKDTLNEVIKSYAFLKKQEFFGSISGTPIRESVKPYGVYKSHNQKYEKTGIISVARVPSSYSLIPLSTFQKIGYFNEAYFIDQIDIDFSLRSIKAGLNIYINKNATFIHNVGEGDINFFGIFLIPVCTPFRHYYQIRNQILCYKIHKSSILTLSKNIIRRIILIILISLIKGDIKNRFYYSSKGLYDGFNSIVGELKK